MRNETKLNNILFYNDRPTGYMNTLIRHYAVIKDFIQGKKVEPVSIEIQPAGMCNMSCRFCGFQEKRKEHSQLFISEKDIKILIEEIYEYNKTATHKLEEIKFNGIYSDPLVKKAKDATIVGIEEAIKRGFAVGLYTNGLNLDDRCRKALVGNKSHSALFVNFSIDAGTWQTYRLLKRPNILLKKVKNEFSIIQQNIKKLVLLRDTVGSKLQINISCVLQNENITSDEIEALIGIARIVGADSVRFRYPYKTNEGAPQRNEIKKAYKKINEMKRLYSENKDFDLNIIADYSEAECMKFINELTTCELQSKAYTKCYACFFRVTVSSNGIFYPCDHRGYMNGGALGHISDGYDEVVNNHFRIKKLQNINPQLDSRCEFCARYNHYLNGLLDLLSNEYLNNKNIFYWIENEYGVYLYDKEVISELKMIQRIINEVVNKGQSIDKSVHKSLLLFIESMLRNSKKRKTYYHLTRDNKSLLGCNREPLEYSEYLSKVLAMVSSTSNSIKNADSFYGYGYQEECNRYKLINSIFRDEGFLKACEILSYDNAKKERQDINKNCNLQLFINNYLEKYSNEPEVILACSTAMLSVINNIVVLSDSKVSADVRDSIIKLLSVYVIEILDNSFNLLNEKYPNTKFLRTKGAYYNIFCDLLISMIHYKIDSMKRYHSYLSRQLLITLHEFEEKLSEYTGRIGFSKNFQPVIILSDAEPLCYPFLGILGETDYQSPVLIYCTRLTCMTEKEHQRYQIEGLNEKSFYSRAAFTLDTKLYGFLRGNNNKGLVSAIDESSREALSTAKIWLFKNLQKKNYSNIKDTNRKSIYEEEYKHFKHNIEKLYLLFFTKRLLTYVLSEPEVEKVLKKIQTNIIPEKLKNDKNKNIVFIDSGIRGSLPTLLSSIIFINELDYSSIKSKLSYIELIINDPNRLEKEHLRARIFMYGVEPHLHSIIPNAGFSRFGHGGANSLIDEQSPKTITFDSILNNGIVQCKVTDEFEQHKAKIIIGSLKELQRKENIIKYASSLEDIEKIVLHEINDIHELYIFCDLDNVVFRPVGYIGSEQWYRDMHSSISVIDETSSKILTQLNKKHDKRLQQRRCYELICDVKRLRNKFHERDIKIIGISSRQENQRKVTENILKQLNILDEFDSLDFLKEPGPTKKERISLYLESRGIVKEGRRIKLFIIDDATHNLYPFLMGEELYIIPILFKSKEANYKGYGSIWFFEEAENFIRNGERLKSKEMSLNALSDNFMELTYKDVILLGNLYQDFEGILNRLHLAIIDSFEDLEERSKNRVEDLLIDLIYANISKDSLYIIAKTVIDINRKYNKCSKANAIFMELFENKDNYINLFSVLKGIEADEKTKVFFKKLSKGEIAREKKHLRNEIMSEILEGISYPTLMEPYRINLKKLLDSSVDTIVIKHFFYNELGSFKEIKNREYVFDNHGNIIKQYKKTLAKIDNVHTEIKIDLTKLLRFFANRLWLIDNVKSYFGINEKEYSGPKINRNLIEQAYRKKKIPIEAIHDKRLLRFMQFLKKHDLRNIVIIGGGVRDALFMEIELADIDTAIKLKLSDKERKVLRKFFKLDNNRILEEAMNELEHMAQSLGFQSEDFLKYLVHSAEPYKPHFEDLEVSYVGPITTKTLDSKENTFIVRILFDADTREELSFNSGIGLLKLGIDMEGNIYGHIDSLKDLLEGKVRLFGDGTNFRIGEILRFLRLKHEFGLKLDYISYGILKWKLNEYKMKRLTLPQIVLYDVKRQAERIMTHAIDKKDSFTEMKKLGVLEIINMSEMGELEIDKVLTNNFKKIHESIMANKRKPRILLINANIRGVNNFIPPIGLYSLRAALDKFSDAEVYVLDLATGSIEQKLIEERLKDSVKTIYPDIVGISFTTPSCQNAFRAAEIVRMTKENTIIIAGGVHPSSVPAREILNGKQFDCVLKGEGEYSISQFVNTIKNTSEIHKFLEIKGLSLKYHNSIFQGDVAKPILNIDDLPMVLLTREDLQHYDTWIIEPKRKAIPIFSSRGCPYACTFCSKVVFGENVRLRNVRNILDEIKYYYESGWTNFTFIDDAFGINPGRIYEFCDLIEDEKLNISWRATLRVDTVSPQLINKMSLAGCNGLAFGLESGSHKIRNEIAKKMTTQQETYNAVRWAKEAGIEEIKLFIMVGLPEESDENVWETIHFVRKADPTNIGLSVATLFPGSQWSKEIDIYHTRLFGDKEKLLPYTKKGNTGKYLDKQPEVTHETATLGREKILKMYELLKNELSTYLYDTNTIIKRFIIDRIKFIIHQLYYIDLEDIVGNFDGFRSNAIQKRFVVVIRQLVENYDEWRLFDKKKSKICEEVGVKDGLSQANFFLLNFIFAALLSTKFECKEEELIESIKRRFFNYSYSNLIEPNQDTLLEQIEKIAELSYITYLISQEQISCDIYDNMAKLYCDSINNPILKNILNRLLKLGGCSHGKVAYNDLLKILRNHSNVKEETRSVDIDCINLHVTQYCNIGCRHCGADAIKISDTGSKIRRHELSEKGVRKVIQLLNTGYYGDLIIAGGGEPTLKINIILEIAKQSKCANIVIVTNGSFGLDKQKATCYFEQFQKVIKSRCREYPLKIKVCISIDKFHQEILPIQAVKNIIDAKLEIEKNLGRRILSIEIILKTLYGFDNSLFELAMLYNTSYRSLKENDEKDSTELSIGNDTFLEVQYAKFLAKSAKSKYIINEIPEELVEFDIYPKNINTLSRYRIGGNENFCNKLDIRIYEDGDIASGREGRNNLVIGNIYKEDITIQYIRDTVIADPIIRTLREDGIEYLIEVAISTYPKLKAKIEKVKAEKSSFIIERILHEIVKDNQKKIVIAYKILKDHPQWKCARNGIKSIETYAHRRNLKLDEF